ncbi:hypothetical protein BC628DRAFT_1126704 [Trametes gibbosa]|nr:hypothetical protein BC628DRAFT_1126704 [Trametes gibbosa]
MSISRPFPGNIRRRICMLCQLSTLDAGPPAFKLKLKTTASSSSPACCCATTDGARPILLSRHRMSPSPSRAQRPLMRSDLPAPHLPRTQPFFPRSDSFRIHIPFGKHGIGSVARTTTICSPWRFRCRITHVPWRRGRSPQALPVHSDRFILREPRLAFLRAPHP